MKELERDEVIAALRAVCEGYTQIPTEGYIVVKNPDFQEDNGSNPHLVIDCQRLITFLEEAV